MLLQELIVYIWLLPVVMFIFAPVVVAFGWSLNRLFSVKEYKEIVVADNMVCAN